MTKAPTLQNALEMIVGKSSAQQMVLAESRREAEKWFEEYRETSSKDYKIKTKRMLDALAKKKGFKIDAKRPNDCITSYRIPIKPSPDYLVGYISLDISLSPKEKYTSKQKGWHPTIAENSFYKFYIEPTFDTRNDWDDNSKDKILSDTRIIFREPIDRIARSKIEKSLTIEGGVKRLVEFVNWYKSTLEQYTELSQTNNGELRELKRKQKSRLERYYKQIGKGKHPGFNRGMFKQVSSNGVSFMTLD